MRFRRVHPRPPRLRPFRRPRPGFTILEVVLASVLGSLMLFAAFALMGAMDRSQRRLSHRAVIAMELATAHGALARAFTNVLMSEQSEPNEELMAQRKKEDVKTGEGDRANDFERGSDRARLAIQPTPDRARMDGAPLQHVILALRTPPVYGGLDPSAEAEAAAAERPRSRFSRERSTDRSRSGGSTMSADQLSAADQAVGGRLADALQGAAPDESDPNLGLDSPEHEPAIATGVRGVFEFRPESLAERRASASDEGTSWALWWRETPVNATNANLEALRGRAAAPERPTRNVRLLSNLRWGRWSVFRDGVFRPKINALFAGHLPAYVQFQFETMDGRREDWVFEVAWSTGPEPGTPIDTTRLAPTPAPSEPVEREPVNP